jgi:hypothetical protein
MNNRIKIYYNSHVILFIVVFFYFLDLITKFRLSPLFYLQPSSIAENLELWRFFTFPLATNSIEGSILFIFTFFILAPKIELLFNRFLYLVILSIFILFQGSIFTILLWKTPIIIEGMESLSLFIITIFTLQHIKNKLVVLNKLYLPTFLFSLLIFLIWISILFVHALVSSNYLILLEGLYSSVYAISTGMITYLQINHQNKMKLTNEHHNHSKYDYDILNNNKDESYALIENKKYKKHYENLNRELKVEDNKEHFNEQKLNEILDKIYSNGKNSLTENEKKFLDDYSTNL